MYHNRRTGKISQKFVPAAREQQARFRNSVVPDTVSPFLLECRCHIRANRQITHWFAFWVSWAA